MIEECEWYLDGFCCKDLDAGRCWDCTAPNKESRINEGMKDSMPGFKCKYPRLGK